MTWGQLAGYSYLNRDKALERRIVDFYFYFYVISIRLPFIYFYNEWRADRCKVTQPSRLVQQTFILMGFGGFGVELVLASSAGLCDLDSFHGSLLGRWQLHGSQVTVVSRTWEISTPGQFGWIKPKMLCKFHSVIYWLLMLELKGHWPHCYLCAKSNGKFLWLLFWSNVCRMWPPCVW